MAIDSHKYADEIRTFDLQLFSQDGIRISDLAVSLGNVIAAGASVQYASLRYTSLEVLMTDAFTHDCGDYKAILCLVERAPSLVIWWTTNMHSCVRLFHTPGPALFIAAGASMTGWEVSRGDTITGGHLAD